MLNNRVVRSLIVISVCTNISIFAGGVKFHDLPYESAAARANAEEKIIFIDFFTTWCAPCKEMDRTTFQDPDVAKWLSEHTIALKVDAEANETNEALAKRFGVRSFPNYVYLSAEGEILDRITGKKDSHEFLNLSASVIAGENSVTRARRNLAQGDENDPMLRMQLGDAYKEMGRNEEALREYLWCFDEGTEHVPTYSGVRVSFLLSYIANLGTYYHPAREALVERRDAARTRILEAETGDEAARVFARINDSLGASDETLTLLDSLKDSNVLHAEAARILAREAFDLLVEAGRYEDIVSYLDVLERAEFHLSMFDHRQQLDAQNEANLGEEFLEIQRDTRIQLARQPVAACYQVLVGVGELDAAATVASQLLERLNDANTRNALAWAGYLSGQPVEENLQMAREAYEQTDGNNLPIVNTFARLLAVLGDRDEAVSVAKAGLAKATSPEDRALMNQCLEFCDQPE